MEENTLLLNFIIERGNFLTAGNASSKIKKILQSIGLENSLIRKISIATYEAEMNLVTVSYTHLDVYKRQAILSGWNLSFIPDLTFAFHSEELDNGKNFISYRNSTINKLLTEARKYKNEEERINIYKELQSKIIEELPYINLYFKTSSLIVNNRVKGPISPTDYNIFNNIEEWYIKYK